MSRPPRDQDASARLRELGAFLRALLRPMLIIAAVVAAALALVFVR